MRKKAKEAENYTQALGELKCAYTNKKWLFYFRKGTAVLIYLRTALSGLYTVWIVFDDFITFVAILYYIWGHHCICGQFFITFEGFIKFVVNYYICGFNSSAFFGK